MNVFTKEQLDTLPFGSSHAPKSKLVTDFCRGGGQPMGLSRLKEGEGRDEGEDQGGRGCR